MAFTVTLMYRGVRQAWRMVSYPPPEPRSGTLTTSLAARLSVYSKSLLVGLSFAVARDRHSGGKRQVVEDIMVEPPSRWKP